MKNAKQNKVVKKTIRNYEPNNAWKYQQEKESNIGMSHLEQKEEEGKQYEQMNYEQLKKYVDCLMLSEQEMQKKVDKMKKAMKKMDNTIEQNNNTMQKMEKKFKKQSDEIDKLYQKVSKKEAEAKKYQLQIKQLRKIIRYMGVQLGINSLSDNLDKIEKKYIDKVGTYYIQKNFRKEIIDTSYR